MSALGLCRSVQTQGFLVKVSDSAHRKVRVFAVVTAGPILFFSSASAAQSRASLLDDACGSQPAVTVAPSDTLTLDHAVALTMQRSPRLEAVCWEVQALT